MAEPILDFLSRTAALCKMRAARMFERVHVAGLGPDAGELAVLLNELVEPLACNGPMIARGEQRANKRATFADVGLESIDFYIDEAMLPGDTTLPSIDE